MTIGYSSGLPTLSQNRRYLFAADAQKRFLRLRTEIKVVLVVQVMNVDRDWTEVINLEAPAEGV